MQTPQAEEEPQSVTVMDAAPEEEPVPMASLFDVSQLEKEKVELIDEEAYLMSELLAASSVSMSMSMSMSM